MFNKSQDGAVYRVSRSEKENSLGEKLFPLFLQISLLIKKIESFSVPRGAFRKRKSALNR